MADVRSPAVVPSDFPAHVFVFAILNGGDPLTCPVPTQRTARFGATNRIA